MRFYTNIVQWGNNLLLREVVNGERINRKVKYSPTLFRTPKDDGERSLSQHKTLQGNSVVPKKFETIKNAKEWVEKHGKQTAIYGNTQFAYKTVLKCANKKISIVERDEILENRNIDPSNAIEFYNSQRLKPTKKLQTKDVYDLLLFLNDSHHLMQQYQQQLH